MAAMSEVVSSDEDEKEGATIEKMASLADPHYMEKNEENEEDEEIAQVMGKRAFPRDFEDQSTLAM